MKRFLSLVLLFAVCLSLVACNQSDDSLPGSDHGTGHDVGDTGSSKEMTTMYLKSETIRYDANGNEVRREVFEYDDQGRPIETTVIQNGEVYLREVFEYDSDGNMTFLTYRGDDLYRQQKYNSERTPLLRIQYENGYEAARYEFNDYGHEILFIEHNPYDGKESRSYTREYEYDDLGNVISSVTCWKVYGVEAFSSLEREYDGKGNLLRAVEISPNGTETLNTYEYDSDGNMLLNVRYSNGKESSRIEYEYDDQGNKIVEVKYEDKSVTRQEYNNRGQRVLYLSYYDGEESYRTETEYDDKGNLILEVDYHDGIETRRHSSTYEYDTNGRPTKCSYSNGETEVYHYVEFTTDEESAEELKEHYMWLSSLGASDTGTFYW